MTIEGGLYHDSQYDRSRPVGGYWEAQGLSVMVYAGNGAVLLVPFTP